MFLRFLPTASRFAPLAALLALTGPAAAQTQPASPPTATKPQDSPTVTVVEFADQPLVVESIGLRMSIPVGVRTAQTTVGSRATTQVMPKDNTWLINVQTPRTSNELTTTSDVVDEVVLQLFRAAGVIYDKNDVDLSRPVGFKGKILEPKSTIKLATGEEASRIYICLPPVDASPAVVRGYTVFKISEEQFATFELVVTEPQWSKAKSIYEAVIATAQFADSQTLNTDRRAGVVAGVELFSQFTSEDLASIVEAQPERWERLFKPGTTGAAIDDTEIAYRRITAKRGTRADVGGTGSAARERGFVVQIDARALFDKQIVDSRGVYFMSESRQQELWNVRITLRDMKTRSVSRSVTELGARDGDSISVQIDAGEGQGKIVRPTIAGDGYICQVESWLLPQLLVRGKIPTSYAFYAYQSDPEAISLRQDVLEQLPGESKLWRLTSTLGDKSRSQISTYESDGTLIKTQMPDGSVWEPTTADKLMRLWREKSLPTD